jgi:hypothetical protein
MLAALGTALTSSIFGVAMFIFISITFALRLNNKVRKRII